MTEPTMDTILHREISNLRQLFTASLDASDRLTARRFTGVEEHLAEIKISLNTFYGVKETVIKLEATQAGAKELKRSIVTMGTLIVTALGLVASRL